MAKTEDGKNISFVYTGIIDMTEDVWKIFNMDPEMKTVDFGLAGKLIFSLRNLSFVSI